MTDLRARLQTTLGNAYAIERELGGGGMSRVFVAREVALGRDVVVKIVSPELSETLSAERFAREVQVAARLQQANIVPVLAAGNGNGMAYYTMPYVGGQSLRTRIAAGALPLGDALDVLRDVARALAYAHAEGIVARRPSGFSPASLTCGAKDSRSWASVDNCRAHWVRRRWPR